MEIPVGILAMGAARARGGEEGSLVRGGINDGGALTPLLLQPRVL